MFGMFRKKVDLSDLSKITRYDLKELKQKMNEREFDDVLKRAAVQGSFDCQLALVAMSGLLMQSYGSNSCPSEVLKDFEKYSKLAAGNGDAESQFNLGKLYMSKVDMSDGKLYSDDHEYVRQAEYWLKKAQKQGHPDAVSFVPDFEDIFHMAR
jgi:hypothetical protein